LGSRVPVVGVLKNVQVKRGSATLCNTNFAVVSGKMDSFDGILGTPFLRSVQAELNFKTDELVTPVHRVKFMRRAWTYHHTYQVTKELDTSEDLVQECFAAMLSAVNQGNIQLSASSTQVIPACTTTCLRVACPVKFVNKVMVVEPITLPSGLAVGGACIQSENRKDHYLPVMNLSESDVTVRRGEVVTYALHVKDPRMLIGLEEEWTEEEYYSLEVPSPMKVTPIVEGEKIMPQQCRDCNVTPIVEGEERMPQQCDNCQKQKTKCSCSGTKCARDEKDPREKYQSKRSSGELVSQAWRPAVNAMAKGCKTGIRGLLTKERVMERMQRPPHTFDLLKELELDKLDQPIAVKEITVNADHCKKIIEEMIQKSECPDHLLPALRKLLWKHRRILAGKDDPVGLCRAYKPGIPLDTPDPLYTPQYLVPYEMRQEIRKAIQDFLEQGIIRPSSSPYNSPSLMVPKRDGGYRLVVDFRRLNKHVITDPHPLPRISQIMEALGSAVYFTALDLLHGFYNLEIREEDRCKTAFSTPDGHWEFIRLPMGLKNSPSIFQRLMSVVLSGSLGHHAFIYIDDILVFSKDAESHIQHLDEIMEKVNKAGLRVKASKCQLFRTEVEYLGFLAGKDGLKVNPRKMEAVEKFPVPRKIRDVQAFLGLVGYFRIFVTSFANRAQPLYGLLKKENAWMWSKEHQEAFEDLKKCLLTAPILAFPDFRKPFCLTTDASGYAVGAILTQIQSGKERLIACTSRVLTAAEKN
jgi:hypothetical protein